MTTLFIPGRFPSLNEVIGAAKGANGRGIAYARMKRDLTDMVALEAKAARLGFVDGPVSVSITWREKNRRRDIDNVSAGGTKFILDGLVKAGVLENDSPDVIYSLEHRFQVDKQKPGVLIAIQQECPF